MQIRIRATGWAIIDSARPGSGPEEGVAGEKGAGSRGAPVNIGGELGSRRQEHAELLPEAVSVAASPLAWWTAGPWVLTAVGSWETESKGLWTWALRVGVG